MVVVVVIVSSFRFLLLLHSSNGSTTSTSYIIAYFYDSNDSLGYTIVMGGHRHHNTGTYKGIDVHIPYESQGAEGHFKS